jgi:hypothetical protein
MSGFFNGKMAEARLLRTTDENGHNHFVYVSPSADEPATGHAILLPEASISKNNGHTHPLSVEQEEGKPVILAVGEAEGHTHAITGEADTEKGDNLWEIDDTDEGEEKSARRVKAFFKEARELEDKYVKSGQESYDFYWGDKQWTDADRSKLHGEKRSALTINQIGNKMDLLSGLQRQNRTDMRIYPTEGGDGRVSDILNVVIDQILDNTKYGFEETRVFNDGSIAGRGLFDISRDFSKDPMGDLIIKKHPWDMAFFGPHDDEDLSDLDYLVKVGWENQLKVEEMYPEKSDEITALFEDPKGKQSGTYPHQSNSGDRYNPDTQGSTPVVDGDSTEFIDMTRKRVKILTAWQKVQKRIYIAMMPEDDFYQNLVGLSKNEIKSLKTIEGLKLIPQVVHRMRMTITAGDVVLEDDYPDTLLNDFPLIPYYAKKYGEKFKGKVEDGKDPQRLINKLNSLLSDILTKMAAYGWFIDEETFGDPDEEKRFKETSSSPGWVVKIRNLLHTPKKEEGIKMPAEVISTIPLQAEQLKQVLGISDALQGFQQTGRESGVAIGKLQRFGLAGNEFLFDNLTLAKLRVGKMVIAHVQKHYTTERIMRILKNQSFKKDKQFEVSGFVDEEGNDQPKRLQEFTDEDFIHVERLLDETDLLKYDIRIAENLDTPTARDAERIFLAELAGSGIQLPPEFFIELSNLSEEKKNRAIEAIQAQRQEDAQAEQRKGQVELAKTSIAAQSKQTDQ